MLVLQRKENESVVIDLPDGRTIEILLTKIFGDKARIGIQAPADVRIFRRELKDRIDKDAVKSLT